MTGTFERLHAATAIAGEHVVESYADLSPVAITKCVDALRYLQKTFGNNLRLDQLDMECVDRALVRVDVELSCRRVDRLTQIAAE